jgi:hypothetical protein
VTTLSDFTNTWQVFRVTVRGDGVHDPAECRVVEVTPDGEAASKDGLPDGREAVPAKDRRQPKQG